MALMSERSWEDWVNQYAKSHHHPVNRVCHTIGIPTIVVSLPLFIVAIFVGGLFWIVPAALFVIGWIFQFVGHHYEGKPPEFLQDWRFLFVGMRWWLKKMRGQA